MATIAQLGIEVRTDGVSRSTRELDALEKQANETGRAANTLGKIWGTAVGAFSATAIIQATRALTNQADQWSKLRAQLSLAFKDTQGLAVAQAQLFDISQRTGTDLSATTELYSKLAQASEALAGDQTKLVRTTELVSKALTISGADAASTAAVIRQFSQALAAGALRGDEFVSVMEGAPRIARAIADGLDVPIGKLRELASEGKLTADRVTEALLRSGEAIDKEFGRMPATVGRAMQQVENSILQLIGKTDEATGSSRALAGAIADVADALSDPKTVQAFQDTASGLAQITAATVRATGALASYVNEYKEWLADRGFLPTDENSTREQLIARRDRAQGVLERIEMGRTFFGDDTARGLRQQLRTIDLQLNGNEQTGQYLDLPSYLQDRPFTVAPPSLAAPGAGTSSRPTASDDPEKPRKRAAAVRELSAAEKAYQDILETNALIDEQAADAVREIFFDRQRATEQAAEEAKRRLENNQSLIGSMEQELTLLRSNTVQREQLLALSQLEVGATEAHKQAVADLAEEIVRTREQIGLMDQVRGSLSDTFSDVLTGAKSAKEALGDFFDSLFEQTARALADQAVQQLFGSYGSAGGGAAGGNWFSQIAGIFAGGRAIGGPVSAGRMYEVGERGPEVLTMHGRNFLIPPAAGKVAPVTSQSGATGQGVSVHQVIQVTGQVDRRSASQIATETGRNVRIATMRNGA